MVSSLSCLNQLNLCAYTNHRNWTGILDVLGPHIEPKPKSYRVSTKAELDALLDDREFAQAGRMQLVEVKMEMHDAPRALKAQTELSGQTNAYVAQVGPPPVRS